MNRTFLIILSFFAFQMAKAQELWTVDRCMAYAIHHSHDVEQKKLTLQNYRADHTEAIGAFLPRIEGSVGAQYNFGRAINPETNTYNNVNTFYNNYGIQASLPVFDGMQRISQLNIAKAHKLMGKYGLQAAKDNLAIQVFQAFIDVLYYRGTLRMANEKRNESALIKRQTEVMTEVGQKSEADIALIEATLATDEYEVTRQQNLLTNAEIALKQLMNYPLDDSLYIDTTLTNNKSQISNIKSQIPDSPSEIFHTATLINPELREAEANVIATRHTLRNARGALIPSLSVGAGISTTYYRTLGTGMGMPFHSQFHNNAGEYIYASLTIPIFNRLSTVSAIRRQRNNLRIAQHQFEQKTVELEKLIYQAVADRNGYEKETIKMKSKVKSDSLAAHITLRKYQEGQSSAIEVQTAAVNLLQSKASLLQCELSLILKEKLIAYYKGIPLIDFQQQKE